MNKLSIKFNKHQYTIKLSNIELNRTIWSRIVLLAESNCINIKQINNEFIELFLSDFIKFLSSFAEIIKREKIRVDYDEQSLKMIKKFINEQKNIANLIQNKSKIEIFERKLIEDLNNTRMFTDFQIRDIELLANMQHGANFSVPGAGKTYTTLAVHNMLKKKGIVDKLLVVAPRNAFISWEDEINDVFKNSYKIVRLVGGKQSISTILASEPEMSIINYHQVPYVVDDLIKYLSHHKCQIILDESHRIKRGEGGVHFDSIIKLAGFAVRRDILTGTPLPQSINDLYAQFDFIWPGSNLFSMVKDSVVNEETINLVSKKLKPLYVRTTKSELGLIKPKLIWTPVDLGTIQNELYSLVKHETYRQFMKLNTTEINKFRTLGHHVIRLLQIASNPMLITSNNLYPDELISLKAGHRKWELLQEYSKFERPAKIKYVIDRVYKLLEEGEKKIVIWSSFIQNINLLESQLKDFGALSIYGAIKTGDENDYNTREGRIKKFCNNVNSRVLIANPAACGEGISLHKAAHYAIYLDRTFNATHYLQSVDRIHRLGLAKNVNTNIEIVTAKNTIDLAVESRLAKKIETMGKVLDDSDLKEFSFDVDDVNEEFEAGIDYSDINEIVKHLKE